MSRAERLTRGAGLFLGSIMVLGVVLALGDEAVRLYRGWKNTNGTAVPGYGLFEKQYSSPLVEKELQKIRASRPAESPFPFRAEKGWELVDFSQWEFLCQFQVRGKQRAWTAERTRLLKERGGFSTVLPKDVLAEIWSSTAPELSADDPVRKVLYIKNVEKRFGSLPEGPPLFTEADLPMERYKCGPTKMLYQPGQGWGLF